MWLTLGGQWVVCCALVSFSEPGTSHSKGNEYQSPAAITHVLCSFFFPVTSCYTYLVICNGMVLRQNTVCQMLIWSDYRSGQQLISRMSLACLKSHLLPSTPHPVKLPPEKATDLSLLKQCTFVGYRSFKKNLLWNWTRTTQQLSTRRLIPRTTCWITADLPPSSTSNKPFK